mgnify:CR=1 FL=1
MPEHLIDCKRILKWLLDHAGELGFDPDSVFLTGGSAGAHLALLMALTPNRPEFQPGFEEVNTRVQGWTGFYGAYDFYSCFEKSDLETFCISCLALGPETTKTPILLVKFSY